MASNSAYKYQVGGSLEQNAPSYVVREADEDFYQALKAGEFCYVLNSRQMGKSSLRVQVMRRLKADGVACSVIDITTIGTHDITPGEWYLGIVRRLARGFGSRIKPLAWWNELEGLSPLQRLNEFIEQVLLVEIPFKIVIFIDEIDSILKLDFKDDFFALIRSCYNQRAENQQYQRLTFGLLGVATPSDLIQDKNRTPFNIGKAIDLKGFQPEKTLSLARGLEEKVENPQQVIREILTWTGGQPFLTQKLCRLVAKSVFSIARSSEADLIEQLVRSLIIENWEAQDEPDHLKTIRDRIIQSSQQRTGRLLALCQQILQDQQVIADDTPEQTELRLTGLVVKRDGKLRISNRIYEEVFNQNWCETELAKLRPYADAIQVWVDSQRQDESRLLRGQALHVAKTWAAGKSLSDLDYQFLAASQDLENREVQKKLEAQEQAKQVLEAANRKANQQIRFGLMVLGVTLIGAVALTKFAQSQWQQAHIAQDGTRLERAGTSELAEAEEDPVGALSAAIKDGKYLQALVNKNHLQKLEQYPAASPVLALKTILDQIGRQLQVLQGHQSNVNNASFSPDGHHIVTASDDKTARVWNLNGHLEATLQGHQDNVNSASFSPDSQHIVTASWDKTARVWDLNGRLEATLRGHQSYVNNASFSPDGHHIVTASWDKTARVWDLNGRLEATLQGHQSNVNNASFSPDGHHIVTASDDKTARVWDLNGRLEATLKGHESFVNSASFSPDNQHIVTTSADKTTRVWNLKGHPEAILQGHQDNVNSASFSPDGQHIVTASKDKTARVWNLNGHLEATLQGHQKGVNSASFSPDSQYIVTASWDTTARIWDLSERLEATLHGHQESVNSASFSPNGQHIVTTSYYDKTKSARVWDLNGRPEATLQGHQDNVNSASFSPDSQHIVTASDDKTARVWDLKGHLEATLQGHQDNVISASFSPDGQHIVTASDDKTARVWDSKGHLEAKQGHQERVNSASFSPDSRHIVTASWDKTARVWDLKGHLEATLQGHQNLVISASFSPDGQHIVTASDDNTARVWDLRGNPEATLQGHQDHVISASFSPDNQHIVTASDDNTARVWDLRGRLEGTLQGHQERVNSASFSPDGWHIVTASDDNTARVWRVERLEQLLTRGCQWLKSYYLAFSPDVYKNNAFRNDANKKLISQELISCTDYGINLKAEVQRITAFALSENDEQNNSDITPPKLPNSATYGQVKLSQFTLNDKGNVISIPPGEKISASTNYIYDCPECQPRSINQIIVGIVDKNGAQACIYDGSIKEAGSNKFTLTAPNNPGIYYIRFRYAQAYGCNKGALGWWKINGEPTPIANIGVLVVKGKQPKQ